jgi:hypothetical protein
MTAILFVVGCVGFAIVAAWAYSVAALEFGASGSGLLAMVECAPPDAKSATPPPRWDRRLERKARAGKPLSRPGVARAAMRGRPRTRGGR